MGLGLNSEKNQIGIWLGLKIWDRYLGLRFKLPFKKPPETPGERATEKVFMILSGYSSRILEIRSVSIPEPVSPPSECVSWYPWRQSQDSASLKFRLSLLRSYFYFKRLFFHLSDYIEDRIYELSSLIWLGFVSLFFYYASLSHPLPERVRFEFLFWILKGLIILGQNLS